MLLRYDRGRSGPQVDSDGPEDCCQYRFHGLTLSTVRRWHLPRLTWDKQNHVTKTPSCVMRYRIPLEQHLSTLSRPDMAGADSGGDTYDRGIASCCRPVRRHLCSIRKVGGGRPGRTIHPGTRGAGLSDAGVAVYLPAGHRGPCRRRWRAPHPWRRPDLSHTSMSMAAGIGAGFRTRYPQRQGDGSGFESATGPTSTRTIHQRGISHSPRERR